MNNRNFIKVAGSNSHIFFDDIISLENLFSSWNEFKRGKEKRIDVQEFTLNLEDNIFDLNKKLSSGKYQHSNYISFYICDPKLRHINKATISDRVVHHALMRIIEPVFERIFIFDSYSSRKSKGTHRAISRFKKFAWKLSHNNTKAVWVLKCDVRKFFNSVNHDILCRLIRDKVDDKKTIILIENIICSFQNEKCCGIPLGNVTSQLFSNIYLNELDQFIKHVLKVKYYIRYVDDFVILSRDEKYLYDALSKIDKFLHAKLRLFLHDRKVSIRQWHKGVDFLGYIIFPHHTVIRTRTKKRILKRIREKQYQMILGSVSEDSFRETLQSYFGVLHHCRSRQVKKDMEAIILILSTYSLHYLV
ncbi:MAG: reverse transcriptase domain-containing protein [Candidatus Komeilibacteria bacterium]